jgi:hypothetical protein
MYILKAGIKTDPVRRWALPDRIFFGHVACAILAGVYLRDPPLPGFFAERCVPAEGFAGHHIYVTDGIAVFDHHGYSLRTRLLRHHTNGWAGQYPEGWSGHVERADLDLLDGTALNQNRMFGPAQYLHDPIPRAEAFLRRIDHHMAHQRATGAIGPYCA